jgi:hypothetical protein
LRGRVVGVHRLRGNRLVYGRRLKLARRRLADLRPESAES